MKTPGGGYEVCYILIMGWLFNEELCDLFSLPDVLGVLKSRRMRWAEQRNAHRFLVGKPALIQLGRLGKDGKIMLKQILKKWEGRVWTGLIRLGTGTFVNTVMKLWAL
jgi:hypothetical protein